MIIPQGGQCRPSLLQRLLILRANAEPEIQGDILDPLSQDLNRSLGALCEDNELMSWTIHDCGDHVIDSRAWHVLMKKIPHRNRDDDRGVLERRGITEAFRMKRHVEAVGIGFRPL